jgi:hypothetical protein
MKSKLQEIVHALFPYGNMSKSADAQLRNGVLLPLSIC